MAANTNDAFGRATPPRREHVGRRGEHRDEVQRVGKNCLGVLGRHTGDASRHHHLVTAVDRVEREVRHPDVH